MAKVDPGKLKDEATKHLRRGKLDKALESYRQLEKASPNDLKVPQKVAEILQKMDRKPEAAAKYKEAAEKYYNKGFLVQAIAIYKIVTELSPEDDEVKNALEKLSRERQDSTFTTLKPSRVSEKIQSAPPAKKQEKKPEPEPEPEEAKEEPPLEAEPEPPGPSGPEAAADAEEAVAAGPEADEEEEGVPFEPEAGEEAEADSEEELREEPAEDMEVVPVEEEEELPESGPERTPLLSDLDPPEFERVFELMESRIIQPEEAVVKEGESGDSLFIVARGQVKVVRDENEKQKTLAVLGPGDFFGEIGYFHGKREASVIAVKRSLLLEMAKADLDEVVNEFPRVKEVLLQFYRERVLDNLLRNSPLFKNLSGEERKQFGNSFNYREVPAGETIVKEGDPGDSMFLIKSGEVSIQAQHPVSNKQMELARLQGGDFFGEVSLIKNKPRTATVLVESPAEILELKRDDFQKISQKHPEIGKAIEHTIEQRVEETIKKMIDTMES